MPDEPFTREEFRATAEPMQRDISEIKEAVKPIPAILAQVERTNSKVADHETQIGKLEDWQQRLIGAGGVILLLVTIFGAVLLREVI